MSHNFHNDTQVRSFIKQLETQSSIEDVNQLIFTKTKINFDFEHNRKLQNFIHYANKSSESYTTTSNQRHWGDVQTPVDFVDKVYRIISEDKQFKPTIILEPTFGLGNFLMPLINYFPETKSIYGIEIQSNYIWEYLLRAISKTNKKQMIETHLFHDDFFIHDFTKLKRLTTTENKILVIGNPPWVTNSEMSVLDKNNLPEKKNYKNFKGFDALTGKSNFDITEAILHTILKEFGDCSGKIALLCKNTVIKNIIKNCKKEEYPISNIHAINFDTKKVFGKSCNASLFLADLTPKKSDSICNISSFSNPFSIIRQFGWWNGKFVSDLEKYKKNYKYDGRSIFHWRHGVKHNCSKVLELKLTSSSNILTNKLHERISLESDRIFPYLKGSDLKGFHITDCERRFLLTQKTLQDNPEDIKNKLPLTWNYLKKHEDYFTKRKSRVFKNKHTFSIFGVGNYLYKDFKVAVPSLYKKVKFVLISPINNKPVLLDDTCYYLGFNSFLEALVIVTVLNHNLTRELIDSLVFKESKRPYTKELLMRINLIKLLRDISLEDYRKVWDAYNYKLPIDIKFSFIEKVRDDLLKANISSG